MTRDDPIGKDDRLDELLTQHVLYGLTPEEQDELESLGLGVQDLERKILELESAAAAIDLAFGIEDDVHDAKPLPPDLQDEILAHAKNHFAGSSPSLLNGVASSHHLGPWSVPPPNAQESLAQMSSEEGPEQNGHGKEATTFSSMPDAPKQPAIALTAPDDATLRETRSRDSRRAGPISWLILVAAAILLTISATNLWMNRQSEDPWVIQSRLQNLSGTIELAWVDPNGDGQVSGRILWNSELQLGTFQLDGLPPNEPSLSQYQLWIVDGRRAESPPIDGGVFDITGEDQPFVIDPLLPIFDATQFVVTEEDPGGVVVSDGPARATSSDI